jgi:hypothetical protein
MVVAQEGLYNSPDRFFVETQNNFAALHQDGTFDQVRILRHEPQGFLAGRRMVAHASLTIQLVARVEELSIVALSNEPVQFVY